MSPVPCACAAVVLRYCQLRAASSIAADRYMGDRWWVLEGRLDCDRADFSWITVRMCRVLSRDGSVRETFCKICREGRLFVLKWDNTMESTNRLNFGIK